jgi:hypothetical protein
MIFPKFSKYPLLLAANIAALLAFNCARSAAAQDIVPRATPPVPLPGADPSNSPPNANAPAPSVYVSPTFSEGNYCIFCRIPG